MPVVELPNGINVNAHINAFCKTRRNWYVNWLNFMENKQIKLLVFAKKTLECWLKDYNTLKEDVTYTFWSLIDLPVISWGP